MNTNYILNYSFYRSNLESLFEYFSNDEINEIFFISLREAINVTFKNKTISIKNFLILFTQNTIKTVKYLYKTIKEEKFGSFKKIFLDVKDVTINRIKKMEILWKKMPFSEKKEALIDFLIISFSTLIVGGGFDMEGGVPDLDLKTGIGNHRNLFTHTILLGFSLELALRFIGNILINLEKKGIEPESEFLSKVLSFVKDKHEKAIQGMWLGLFFHYLKDANLFSNKVKPYVGLKGFSMKTHKNLFASNAILSVIFAINSDKNKNFLEDKH
ncbi:hypothetical protein [Marinitoga sp. 1155]|uniref:hypothetical protein n=1 Tax=Marinitoga sp. 1155 TaxID=1428448 RepID=UPI00064128A0|nr:hypothetical protein [Marinitoga sp. 1155]KLO23526.1 hypothetical protein X274_06475 [Marinitoga sp. 1155]